MCGIVGYVGSSRKCNYIINKLKKLEYRGYDSAGVCNLLGNKFSVYKEIGKIVNLEKKIDENLQTECSIAHTRWATNGRVTTQNCHPHLSKDGNWAIVHNGIIENFEALKDGLKMPPESDTDTAVVAEGLDEANAISVQDFISYFRNVTGSFAIVAMNKNVPNALYLAKRKNPLYIAKSNDGDFLVASDPICFESFSNSYFSLDDDEFALIESKTICFYNSKKEIIEKKSVKLTEEFEIAEKQHFSTFMLKEIFDEEDALKNQVKTYRDKKILEQFDKDFLCKFNSIMLIGCGTAYHACKMGAKYFQKILKVNATAEIASEFIYSKPCFANNDTLVILVSQSGETADTLKALEIAKEKGATVLAFTNVSYSTLAKKADINLPICAGVEIAVASTKAYVCQLSALYLLVSYFEKDSKNDYFVDIENVSNKILQFNQNNLKNLASKIYMEEKCFFIGKDLDYITALESALKINETTYINSNCYPSGELKHGFLALIEKGTPLFVFATQKDLKVKTLNSAEEAYSRGAERIFVTNDEKIKAKYTIFVDEQNELLAPLIAIAQLQFLACEISRLKNIDPDQPRNLAKSVTVE